MEGLKEWKGIEEERREEREQGTSYLCDRYGAVGVLVEVGSCLLTWSLQPVPSQAEQVGGMWGQAGCAWWVGSELQPLGRCKCFTGEVDFPSCSQHTESEFKFILPTVGLGEAGPCYV